MESAQQSEHHMVARRVFADVSSGIRTSDIWRSFVAQRIAWENGWSVLFHEATVSHQRNKHKLMCDFEDEIPGYLSNRRICDALDRLSLTLSVEHLNRNLRTCYSKLVEMNIVGGNELALLDAWIADRERLG
jgi:hypothetical protein